MKLASRLGILGLTFLLFSFFFSAPLAAKKAPEKPKKAPSFERKSVWISSPPLKPRFFRNKITLIYFWDYVSIGSLRELKVLKDWEKLYAPFGLQIVMIHAPEFPAAKAQGNVEAAVQRLKISFPVVLDNDFKLWEAYAVKSWPTKILVDQEGLIRYQRGGESAYLETENKIRSLLSKNYPVSSLPEPIFTEEPEKFAIASCGPMSMDTYLGHKRSGWWGARIADRPWGAVKDETVNFRDRGDRAERGFFAEGLWVNEEDALVHARSTERLSDYAGLLYIAREAYAFLSREKETGASRVYVTRDGAPVPSSFRGSDLREDVEGGTYFLYEEPRLYYLIHNEDLEPHELKVWTSAKGVAVHSFSFSNRCLSDFEHL